VYPRLAHSSSVSSINRCHYRLSPGEVSPPLSATGQRGHRRSHSSNPVSISILSPQRDRRAIGTSATLVQHATATFITTTGTKGSSVTTDRSITDPVTGEVGRLSLPGWAGATLTFYPRSRSHMVMTCGCSRAGGVEARVQYSSL
jgi:hypothetical protein